MWLESLCNIVNGCHESVGERDTLQERMITGKVEHGVLKPCCIYEAFSARSKSMRLSH